MKRAFILIIMLYTSIIYGQNSNAGPEIPLEVQQWEFVLGQWSATNKSILKDGSGNYQTNENLTFIGKKLFDGYGHQVDWYGPEGAYWGTSIRTFNRTSKKWESRWFDIVSSSWQDLHELEHQDGEIVHYSEGEDGFGKYEAKRIHSLSEDKKTYQYKHLRKYENMGQWMEIDSFVAIKKR